MSTMDPDRFSTSTQNDVARAREVLSELVTLLETARMHLGHLLDLVGWTVYPAALSSDRPAADLLGRILRAVYWSLRLEEDMGKEPDASLTWDDQTPLEDGPAVEGFRLTLGRAAPAVHMWTRVLHDDEVVRLVEAVRLADSAGAAAVEQAVRAALPMDVVAVVDQWQEEIGGDIWPRLARNIRGQSRWMRVPEVVSAL